MTDGRELELQANTTHIQWRYVGDAVWTNLVALADLKGDPGDPATNLVTSVAGKQGVVTLDKADVGLANVPNVDATDRANHTGEQTIATVTGLQSELNSINSAIDTKSTLVALTQAEYNALDPKDQTVYYLIKGGDPLIYLAGEAILGTAPWVPDMSTPEGYILVPGNPLFGTTDFYVMKYHAKAVAGVPTSQPDLPPWVSISQETAISTINSQLNVGGESRYHLITEAEWLTLAANVASEPSNWTNNAVGSGENVPWSHRQRSERRSSCLG